MGVLEGTEVVHDDDVARAKRGAEYFSDIGLEDLRVGGPSIVMQAVDPSRRIEDIMVIVFQ